MQVKKGPNVSFHTKSKIPHMKQMFESILLKLQEGKVEEKSVISSIIIYITSHYISQPS